MAKSAVNINNLSNEIAKALSQYSNEITEMLDTSKEAIATKAVKVLKETSPEGVTKSYKKGWGKTKEGSAWVVHNKTDYRLTHLLEKGHAKVSGGRVSAKVHIKPVEEMVIKEFVEDVEKVIGWSAT